MKQSTSFDRPYACWQSRLQAAERRQLTAGGCRRRL